MKPAGNIFFDQTLQAFRAAFCLCLLLIAAAAGMAQDIAISTNAAAALFVNRQPVSAEEFTWFMQQERTAVLRLAIANPGIDGETNLWDRTISGMTARALLAQRTADRIVREKVQQLLFQELGLLKDVGYATFLTDLEQLNRGREASTKQGAIVYGPVSYTQLQYYGHWLAGLRLLAIESLAQSRWDVSDPKLRGFYEQNKELFAQLTPPATEAADQTFEKVRTRVRVWYLDGLYDQLISEQVKSADVRMNQKLISTLIQ